MENILEQKRSFRVWGIHKKYPGLSWFENFMSGHVSIGNVTIFGENAMHWAIERLKYLNNKIDNIIYIPENIPIEELI